MYKPRKNVLPSNPIDINEVHTLIDLEEMIAVIGEPFLLINDKNKNVLIFLREQNVLFSKIYS